jgi:hypothetical protein
LTGSKLWRFYSQAGIGDREILELVQAAGETVFVPSNFFHTVENLEDDTISINQNWFNQWNLVDVTIRVLDDARKVQRELCDFGVTFDAPSDEFNRIELIVKSNNCLNVEILLEVILRGVRLHTVTKEGTQNVLIAIQFIEEYLTASFQDEKCMQLIAAIRNLLVYDK